MKSIFAAALLATVSSGAFAADAIVAAPEAPIVYDTAFTWSGVYVGLHAGHAWGDVSYAADPHPVTDPDPAETFDVSGWLAGAQVGFNRQVGNFVFGIEGDISWANIEGEGSDVDPRPESESIPSFEVDWLSTIRGRAGVAIDRVLIYGTGGVAFAGVTGNISNLEGAGDNRSDDHVHTGWTLGAGAEFAVTNNVSIKGEYLYADFGGENFNFGDFYGAGDLTADADLDLHMIKVGFNVRF
jgi:outer membrane immunogenic protein